VIGESLLPHLFQILDNVIWRQVIKNAARIEKHVSKQVAYRFVANLN
jgi:hypothetical protein